MRVGGPRRPWIAVLAVTCFAAFLGPPTLASASAPGDWTQDQVNTAMQNGVAWLASQQNADGSVGTTYPVAETALAGISVGTLTNGDMSKLTPDQLAAVEKGTDYLLAHQQPSGAFDNTFYSTYFTGLALLALSYAHDLQSPTRDISGAIAKGRNFLIKTQNAPASVTGNDGSDATIPGPSPTCATDFASSQSFCGGWNYNPSYGRSDQSNTGFALTGLAATGGVPGAAPPGGSPTGAALFNLGWQRNVQMLASNQFTATSTTRNGQPANDGGGSYEPGITTGDFASNANDTGSLIFGYAYDGVAGSDAGVTAAIAFGTDVLDEYEFMKAIQGAPRTMIYHTTAERDGLCDITQSGCSWSFAPGEGGYHYSLFALSKGLGQYLPSSLTDKTNFYAKIVDLLLSEQQQDGHWPADLRDDGSLIGSTAFAIMSLGRVGQPPIVNGTVYNDANGNGTRDAGEAGLSGWTVYVDVNDNGTLDTGEPSTTTGADGSYSLQNLKEGTVSIREVTQSGFNCTGPSGCAYKGVKLVLGGTVNGQDFGNQQPPPPPPPVVATSTPRVCASVRAFSIRVRRYKGERIVKVTITVNGKRVKVTKRNGRFRAVVDLTKLPKGRYTVKITATLKGGRVVKGTRRYFTCTKHRDSGPPIRVALP